MNSFFNLNVIQSQRLLLSKSQKLFLKTSKIDNKTGNLLDLLSTNCFKQCNIKNNANVVSYIG